MFTKEVGRPCRIIHSSRRRSQFNIGGSTDVEFELSIDALLTMLEDVTENHRLLSVAWKGDPQNPADGT
jgi:hypothetical protein